MKSYITLLALLLSTALPLRLLHSQDSSRPDPGFGVNGVAVVGAGTSPFGSKVAVDSAGRIVSAGTTTVNGLTDLIVIRRLPDGTLDPAFGNGGVVFGGSVSNAFCRGIAVDESNNILVLVNVESGPGVRSIVLIRLLGGGANAGTADTSFGPLPGAFILGTLDTNSTPVDSNAGGVAIQEDGRIVISGDAQNPAATNSGNRDLMTVRLTPQGWIDPSFNGGSPRYFGALQNESATGVAVDSMGRILVPTQYAAFARVYRVTAAGAPDASVGTPNGGYVALNAATMLGNAVNPTAIAVDADDNVVVCGLQSGAEITGIKLWVAKFSPDQPAATRVTQEDFGATSEAAFELALQPDGKIVVVGNSSSSSTSGVAAIRYNTDGTRDTTFNAPFGGFAASLTGDPVDIATGVAIQRNGAIVLAGSNSVSFFAARLGAPRLVTEVQLQFPATRVKRNSPPRSVTLANTGNALLTGLQYRIVGGASRDYRLLPPNPQSVAAGGSASCRVLFRPLRRGVRNALLQISTANGGATTVRLSGRGK